MLIIEQLLPKDDVAELCAAALRIAYEDGAITAGRYVKEVKHNLQAAPSPERDAILDRVRAALMGHRAFRLYARPKHVMGLLLSRYEKGMGYGPHVDNPIIDRRRADVSFTVALNDHFDYDGGELVVQSGHEERGVLLNAGDAVVYPTGDLHRVEPVTRGARIVVVGWVTSWVRDARRRAMLHDFDLALDELFAQQGKTPLFDRLHALKTNLQRRWSA